MPILGTLAAKATEHWLAQDFGGKAKILGKVFGGIKGFFGGRRDEANRRREHAMYRNYANDATRALEAQVGEERQHFIQRSDFLRQRGELKQATILDSYERNVEKMDSQFGQTGFAYGADENLRRGGLLEAYQGQMAVGELAQKEGMYGYQRDFQSRLRDIESRMLDVQRFAAEKGVVTGVRKGSINQRPVSNVVSDNTQERDEALPNSQQGGYR